MQEQTAQIYSNDDSSFVISAPPGAPPIAIVKRDDVISLGDESALNWYFARGIGIYERSTFGAIIDRLKYGALGSHKCARCEGEGILNDGGGFRVDDTCRRCKGSGSEADQACPQCRGRGREAGYALNVDHGGWCPSCRGTGATGIDRRGSKPPPCRECPGRRSTKGCKNCGTCKLCKSAQACRDCRNCLGTGTEPVSVHPTGEDGATGRDGADDSALTKFALISRRLERVRTKSPALLRAGVAYFGDVGTRWGLTDRGRIFALYPETNAGKRLLAMTRREARKEWKNPQPPFGILPSSDDSPARVIQELWERTWKARRPAHQREFIGPVQERGWLSGSEAREYDAAPPNEHRTPTELIAHEAKENHTVLIRKLLVEAGEQARELYARFAVAFNEAKSGGSTRRTVST